jgi:hypothetical protein
MRLVAGATTRVAPEAFGAGERLDGLAGRGAEEADGERAARGLRRRERLERGARQGAVGVGVREEEDVVHGGPCPF